MNNNVKWSVLIGTAGTWLLIFAIIMGLVGCPKWSVWQQGLAGEAELERAKQNRKIEVEEAMAKDESAEFLNSAEIKRARGTAEANKIIDSSLTEQYLRYYWINEVGVEGHTELIYIPTEAGMPILEAPRIMK